MKHCKVLLFLLDVFIVLGIGFPLSILHWRGTWQLQECYLFPGDRLNSLWLSFAIGSNVCIVELLLQPFLKEKLSTCRRFIYVLVSRLHLYFHGWGVLCYWRGLWGLLDYYLSPGWVNSLIVFCIFQFVMTVTQTIRTAVGLPISLRLDTSHDLLESDLVFKTSHNQLAAFVGDCLFTQFIIVTSTVGIWRSIWNTLDAFIFPQRHYRSDVACLIAGSVSALVFHLASYPLSLISDCLQSRRYLKLFFEDCVFLVLTWTNLLMWRGGWNLCIRYFLSPDGPNGVLLGAWLSHLIGTLGLMALQLFNNVGLHNVERDGIYDGGEGFDTVKYVRALLADSCLVQEQIPIDISSADHHHHHFANGNTTNIADDRRTSSDGTYGIAKGSIVSDDELLSDNERAGLLNGGSGHVEVGSIRSVKRLMSWEQQQQQQLDDVVEKYTVHTSPLFTGSQYSQLPVSNGGSPSRSSLNAMSDLANSRL